MSSPDAFTPGLLSRLAEPPRKVALLRASRIGDFICATPAFRALRAALPKEEFDLAIQMQGSGVFSNPFTLLLGAKATAGFIREGDWPGRLDAALPLPSAGHEVRRVLALPRFLGAPDQGEDTEYALWPEDHLRGEALLSPWKRPLIGLHPGAWDVGRQWPLDRFAAVANGLHQQYGGTIVILSGPQMKPLAQTVAQAIDEQGACLNLAGKTSLGLLGGVISRLAILITNDSGPAHAAYALGTPTVTLFGPSDPSRYGPLQDGPFRLVKPATSDSVTMKDIGVQQVLAAATEIIREPLV